MKKLTCALLVAMFTMTSMLFAQISGGPIVVVSDYITITNKTTKESKTISTSDFTSAGNNKYTYDVDFCLGVYKNDEIEVTYTPKASLAPQIAWSYAWNGGFSTTNLGTAFTANLSVSAPFDKSVLTFTCNYRRNGQSETSIFYNINVKNVHNGNRITLAKYSEREIQVVYAYYAEDCVYSCSGQSPKTSLYILGSENPISTGGLNGIGMGTLDTKGNTGTLVVKVFVNNVDIFTGKILVK